jgi:hypothetical protein
MTASGVGRLSAVNVSVEAWKDSIHVARSPTRSGGRTSTRFSTGFAAIQRMAFTMMM